MKATINKDHKIEIDLTDLCDSLSDDDRALFAQSVVFQEKLLEAVCETVATGGCFEGYWNVTGLADKLRMKLLPLLPEGFSELVGRLVEERDSTKARHDKYAATFARLAQHWPKEAVPFLCSSTRPEYCHCAWNQEQVEAFLAHELGADWRAQANG